MKTVSLLVKPVSSRCNMRCRYCFYEDLAGKRADGDLGLMSIETAEVLVRSAFGAVSPGGEVQFAFQGGEPTLAGLTFYRDFMALVARHRRPGAAVTLSIQTNGLCIDEEWADFLQKNRFLVGLSVDGGRDTHDLYRKDGGGKGTWDRVAVALRLLQSRGVETNLLCVVTRQCARAPQRTYGALKKLGAGYLQFIPCLDPLDAPRGEEPFSIAPREYGKFLCALFDAWYLDWSRGSYVSIRFFDDCVHLMMGLPASTCSTSGRCGAYLVAEADGSLYPCDFYATDAHRLGRLEDLPLDEAFGCGAACAFLAESAQKPAPCAACEWFPLCNGGCRRDWVDGPRGPENYLCGALRQFFVYAGPRLSEIARAETRCQRLAH